MRVNIHIPDKDYKIIKKAKLNVSKIATAALLKEIANPTKTLEERVDNIERRLSLLEKP